MANTLHGPFVPGASTATGSYGTGVGQSNTYTSGNANNDETQAGVALHGFNPDLLTTFVLSGVTCTKDGTTPNQLDIASGAAYLLQSDGTLARCDVAADNTHITSGATVTWHLYLQPDGSWYWNTANTPATNSLYIAQVVTDASGNIASVTDERLLNTTLLNPLAGSLNLPRWASDAGQIFDDGAGGLTVQKLLIGGGPSGTAASAHYEGSFLIFRVGETGATAQGFDFQTWDGAAARIPFGIGAGAAAFAATYFADAGGFAQVAGQATAGSFGVPLIVALADNVSVTTTAQHTICSFTPPTAGLYRVNLWAYINGANPSTISAYAQYTDSGSGVGYTHNFDCEHLGTFTQLNATSLGTPTPLLCFSMPIRVTTGSPIALIYQNSTATPNDHVSGFIERLT